MPVAVDVELARRGNHFHRSRAHQSLAPRPSEPPQRVEELDVFRELHRRVVAADRFEVGAPAEHHADVDLRDPDKRDHDRVGHHQTHRPPLHGRAGAAGDDLVSRHEPGKHVEGVGVDLRIRVDEGEDVAGRYCGARVADRADPADRRGDHAAAVRVCDRCRVVGGGIVRDDHLDRGRPGRERRARFVNGCQQPR